MLLSLLDDVHGPVLVAVRVELELVNVSVHDADVELDQVDQVDVDVFVDVVEVWLDTSFLENLENEEHGGSEVTVENVELALELVVWLAEEE
ncbi:hypothetical protein E4U41_004105 [Claviceps citrina]|nr:hypothetical protein E4U41_004105 [Claviceps citrina]